MVGWRMRTSGTASVKKDTQEHPGVYSFLTVPLDVAGAGHLWGYRPELSFAPPDFERPRSRAPGEPRTGIEAEVAGVIG